MINVILIVPFVLMLVLQMSIIMWYSAKFQWFMRMDREVRAALKQQGITYYWNEQDVLVMSKTK